MNYRGKKDVRVYNECPFQVNLVGQRREYIFPPCSDEGPTMNFVDFDEIEYAHSRGNQFIIGLLGFSEEDQEGMYQALGIKDWRDKVWFNSDIEDIIMKPTLDKMQRVIDIKDMITLERVRGMMVRFINEKRDVSQNVINIVNQRYRELTSGNTNSKIVIRQADVEPRVSADEVADLKRQIAEMQKMMEAMKDTATVKPEGKSDEGSTTEASTPVKRTGRKTAVKK